LTEAKQAKGIYKKAAAFLDGIAKRRIYKDGNHRTAMAVTETFLKMNGEKMGTSNPEKIYKFVKNILPYNMEEVEKWLKNGSI